MSDKVVMFFFKLMILPKNERINSFLLVYDVFLFIFWKNPWSEKNVSRLSDLQFMFNILHSKAFLHNYAKCKLKFVKHVIKFALCTYLFKKFVTNFFIICNLTPAEIKRIIFNLFLPFFLLLMRISFRVKGPHLKVKLDICDGPMHLT